jgi:myo-inositol-1(or 4)-monophosphatase
MKDRTLNEFQQFAIDLARRAGQLLLRSKDEDQKRTAKAGTDYAITADFQVDKFIRDAIREKFQSHSILSEEDRELRGTSEYGWIVDGLDGTYQFDRGLSNNWCVNICLTERGIPVLGVTFAPQRNEMYVSVKGDGAHCNDEAIEVSKNLDVTKAMVAVDLGKNLRPTRMPAVIKRLMEKDSGVTYTVVQASSATSLALVAAGLLDAYMTFDLEPWDKAAAMVHIPEAGGVVLEERGKPCTLDSPSIFAASKAFAPVLFKDFLELY